MRLGRYVALFPLILILGGCGKKEVVQSMSTGSSDDSTPAPKFTSSPEAEKFLKWSMNQHAALKSYKANVTWSMASDGSHKLSEKREISFVAPNKFRVITVVSNGDRIGSISDGSSLVEFAIAPGGGARKGSAPATLASADSALMAHPARNGSILYQFFSGSDNYDGLVDRTSGAVAFGPDTKTPGGEEARTVTFYANGGYGHVSAVIGKKSGLVSSLDFDEDGLRQQIMKDPEAVKSNGPVPAMAGKEVFAQVETNKAIPVATFDPVPPKGVKLMDTSNDGSVPPVPVGKPAPNFELTRLDGSKVKLSALRGKVVMIDFWATWCAPCRESLPITNKMHDTYASKGLEVLAVSTEDAGTVAGFIKDNKYTFPACLDPNGKVSTAYHVNGIPCLVLIDAKGNLSSYMVGLHPESDVLESIKKAGIKT